MFDSPLSLDSLEAAADLDAAGVGNDELLALTVWLESARRLVDVAEARMLGEIDVRGASEIAEGDKTIPWLRTRTLIAGETASRRVKTARATRTLLPGVLDAVRAGKISMDHADVLVRACNPRIEAMWAAAIPTLIDHAQGVTFNRWRTEVYAIANRWDQDGGHQPEHDTNANTLRIADTIDGRVQLTGHLTAAEGEFLRQAIDAQADVIYRRCVEDAKHTPDLAIPNRPALHAMALLELLRNGILATDGTTQAEITLVINADHLDANAPVEQPRDTATIPGSHNDNDDAWGCDCGDHHDGTTEPEPRPRYRPAVFTPDGIPLPIGDVEHWLCDATIYTTITNSLGQILDQGRGIRFANRTQRRALATRDGGCIFPGCTAKARCCDAHHITPWDQFGETNVDTMCCLCRHHHRIIHRPGWRLEITADGWLTITTPTGTVLHSQRHQRQQAHPPHTTTDRQPPDLTHAA